MDLIQLIKQNAVLKTYSQNEYIFKSQQSDTNLYFIESGEVLLYMNGNKLITIGNEQLLGEKSFLLNENKPLDAVCVQESNIYVLTKDAYEQLSLELKNQLLALIVVYLSKRVDKMNQILNIVGSLSKNMLGVCNGDVNTDLKRYLSQIIDLDSFIILKHLGGDYIKLAGDLSFSNDVFVFVNELFESRCNIKVGKNYVYIKTDDYLYLLQGVVNEDGYVLTNALMYSEKVLNYLGEKIEGNKEKDFICTFYLNE